MRAFRFDQKPEKKRRQKEPGGTTERLASTDAKGIAGFQAIKKQSANSASSPRPVSSRPDSQKVFKGDSI